MPIVEVPGLGQVDFPEGTSHGDMVSAIETSLKSKAGQMALEGTSKLDRFIIGVGKTVSDTGQGIGQILGLSDKKDVAETRARDQALSNDPYGKAGGVAGNVAMAVPTMFIPGVNTYKGAAIVGGLLGGSQPVAEGESRGLNAGLGAAGGLLGQAGGNALGRVIKPVQSTLQPEEARLATEATKRGIPLSAGQATGSKPVQIAESVMENLPFTSGPQIAQKQTQQAAFNKAVGSTFGSPETAITPDVAGAARTRIGDKFTELAGRNTLNATDDLVTKLGTLQAEANKFETGDVAKVVGNRLDDLLGKVDAEGKIPGEAYRKFDSALGRTMRSTSNGDLRGALGDIRSSVREAMDKSISPADQAAWKQARREYANLMTVAPLAAKNETGDISGKTLLAAANSSNKNAKFGAPSELADLGRIGRAFVAEQIPNSGTAQRQIIQSLLTGGGGAGVGAAGALATGNDPIKGAGVGAGLMAGGLLAPRAIQMLMNSPAGQAYLTRGLLPMTPKELALLTAAGRGAGAGLLGYSPQQ